MGECAIAASIMWADPSCMPQGGGGGGNPVYQPTNLPKCAQDGNRESSALNGVVTAVQQVLVKAGLSAALVAAVGEDLIANESNSNDVSFVGGHFNLALSGSDIATLDQTFGGNTVSQALATAFYAPSAIGRGSRFGLNLGDEVNLHINQQGGGYAFHIDLNNVDDLVGIARHLGQEMIGGHWPFNNCLDPAFQN